jgi:hypothetical protein
MVYQVVYYVGSLLKSELAEMYHYGRSVDVIQKTIFHEVFWIWQVLWRIRQQCFYSMEKTRHPSSIYYRLLLNILTVSHSTAG